MNASVWVIAGLMVLAVLFLMSVLARLYRKAGPHEALIVYGFRGTRVIKGHGTVIFGHYDLTEAAAPPDQASTTVVTGGQGLAATGARDTGSRAVS